MSVKRYQISPRELVRWAELLFGFGEGKATGFSELKKGIYNLLFQAHKFFAFFQSVRLTFDVDDGAVMQNAVQDNGG